MGKRCNQHVIETKSLDIIRTKINNVYDNGDSLFRGVTERDYGIDGIIELFDNGNPTGVIAFVQVKSTSSEIIPLKRTPNVIACEISSSNAMYTFQNNIPVILFYISIKSPVSIYYANVKELLNENHNKKIKKQKSITVHIPCENVIIDDFELLFKHIGKFYNK